MRLSDVLSKPPQKDYIQVDGFLQGKKGLIGQQVDLMVGNIALNYFCSECDDLRTYCSKGKLTAIFVDKDTISIDTVLECGACKNCTQVWFLVHSEGDITSVAPKIRILKLSRHLSEKVAIYGTKYGEYSSLLDKAELAYNNNLGAGAIIYLRKIYEKITICTAQQMNIQYQQYEGGNPKNFRELLEEVDKQCSIIPFEFKKNGYKLFRELSGLIHGNCDENLGLSKYEALNRLVIGILENLSNRKELKDALTQLGIDTGGENE